MSVGPIPSVRTVLVWRAGVAAGVRVAGGALVVAGIAWFMGMLATAFIIRPMMTHRWPTWDKNYAATGGGNVTIDALAAYNKAAGRSVGLGVTGLGLIAGAGVIARMAVPIRRPRPRCPMCGYSTKDLGTPRCPECGAELPAEFVDGAVGSAAGAADAAR